MSIMISRGMAVRYGCCAKPSGERPGVVVGDPEPDRPADQARVDLRTHRAIPRTEPPVLVNHQPHTGLGARRDHRLEIRTDQRCRLLAENMRPMPRRQFHQLAVRLRRRADLYEVEHLLLLKKLGRIGVASCLGHPHMARSTRCRSVSQTATNCAFATRDHASRWN